MEAAGAVHRDMTCGAGCMQQNCATGTALPRLGTSGSIQVSRQGLLAAFAAIDTGAEAVIAFVNRGYEIHSV